MHIKISEIDILLQFKPGLNDVFYISLYFMTVQVGNLTTCNATQCLCTHLTSFGGEMVVPPNTIDFNNVWAKFKDLNENAAVFSVIISLLGLYVIGLIWARYMDKKDLVKVKALVLKEQQQNIRMFFTVLFFWGVYVIL